MQHFYKMIKSPVGELTLVANAEHLVAILWDEDRPGRVRLGELKHAPKKTVLCETEKQLRQYFRGARVRFELPLEFVGTPFQLRVWRQLQAIPFGETRSYLDLARSLGKPKACRAVGGANGRNPLSIVVPCHRVIGANGKLTGFAGGMKAKKFLLDLESVEN